MVQIQDLHKKVNSLNDARAFYEPEIEESSLWVVPRSSQPMSIPSPTGMISRDSCLQLSEIQRVCIVFVQIEAN